MADIVNQAQTRVTVDGQQAASELTALEKKAKQFKDQMIAANSAGDTKAYNKAKKGLKEVDKEMKNVLRSSYDVNKVLNNLSTAGPKQLKAALQQLNKELNSGKIARGSKEWDILNGKIRLVRTEISKLNSEQTIQQSGWQKFTGGFNKYFTMIGTVAASVTGLSFAFRKLAEDVAKMDDVYADVMKTTGMTREQVVDLNEEFKRMDTRTSREQLNLLARDAGKLGLTAKADILGFVEAGNQIDVALGEDLGEGAIKNIGKITDVFKLSTKELNAMDLKGRMLAVGSAINELGQKSTASEAYMVNFTQRLGGVASQAGISVQNILGYASALDQSGQAVEMSATALQKFIMTLMGDPAKFATIAGLEVTKFSNLLKTDVNGAIIEVLTSLSKKGGFAQLIPIFKDMGLDGARAVGVLSALATNIGKVEEAQNIANNAFSEGTSLTNEYSTKNNNLQASLDKARKQFKDAALDLGERLNPALLTSTNYMVYLVKILPGIIDFFSKYGKHLLYVVSVIVAYNLALKAQNAYHKISLALASANRLATIASAGAKALETGNTIKATQAQLLYDATLKKSSITTKSYTALTTLLASAKALLSGKVSQATTIFGKYFKTIGVNPYLMLLAAIPLVFKGVTSINNALNGNNDEIERLKNKMKVAKEATDSYNESISKEHTSLVSLLKSIANTSEGEQIRIDLLKDLGKEYPNILGYLNKERVTNEQLLAVLKLVNQEYDKRFEISAYQGLIDAESKEAEEAKRRQILIKQTLRLMNEGYTENSTAVEENLKLLNEGNAWYKNDINTISELNAEYNRLSGVISGSISNIVDYKKEVSSIETDVASMEDYDAVVALMNKKADQLLEAQNGLAEAEASDSTEAFINAQREVVRELEAEYDILFNKSESLKKKDPDAIPNNPTLPSGDTEKDSVQRKKVQDALRKLEIDNNKEVIKIKEQFRDGVIQSETEYNARLLDQQDKYDEARKTRLNKLKNGITEASIRDDIEKQITDIDQKALDREIKRQAEIKKILLSADPAAAEKDAFENRLRNLGLFGVDREKLTSDQLATLELLEKQHNERMSKIERPETLKQLKKLNEEQAEEEKKRADLRAKGLISEEQYQHELVLIDIAYTAKKLQVDGLTEEQRIQIQRESFNKQKKLYEDNAEIMDRLNKGKKVGTLEEAKAAELALLDSLFDEELRQTEAYEQARLAIIQKYNLLEEEEDKQKRERMIEVAQFALDSLQTLMSSYSSYIQAENAAETAAINKRYETQIKAAGNNSKKIKKLEEQRDKELAEMNRKNEERSFKIQIAMALASTAQSAINAYNSALQTGPAGLILAPIAAGVAVAAGMLQVATIKKQHEAAMANYWEGGYTGPGGKYDVAGYVHKDEFVITKETLANPNAKRFVDVIDIAQRNNTVSSLKASDFSTAMEYRERVAFNPTINSMASEQERQQQNEYLYSVLNNVVDVLALIDDRFSKPLYARNYVKGEYGMEEAFASAERMDKNVKR